MVAFGEYPAGDGALDWRWVGATDWGDTKPVLVARFGPGVVASGGDDARPLVGV